MNQELSIREFKDFEAGEIYAIIRYIYRTSKFMSDDFDRKFPSVAQFKKHYENILGNPGSFLLVAIKEDKPVGYLALEANPAKNLYHTAMLNMGVVENFRGMGIGKFLLTEAINRAKKEDAIEIIYLMVRADHESAVQLYKKVGFDVLARLDKDTKIAGNYFDGLLMRKFV
jgi:ribosomal protein S18 acetylase RimI-like enzyme